MKRWFPIVVLVAVLVFTGLYIFVYLFRAFRGPEPAGGTVEIWHGDPMARAILLAVLFLIGLVALAYLGVTRTFALRAGQLRVRPDQWEWLVRQGQETSEPPERIAERAIASYRSALEGAVDVTV